MLCGIEPINNQLILLFSDGLAALPGHCGTETSTSVPQSLPPSFFFFFFFFSTLGGHVRIEYARYFGRRDARASTIRLTHEALQFKFR